MTTEPPPNLIDLIAFEAIARPPVVSSERPSGCSQTESQITTTSQTSVKVATEVGPYQVVAQIGSSNLWDVYRAISVEEFVQPVAIAVFRQQINADVFMRRFREGRPIQAALGTHPNIAKLLDAGVTQDGLIYLAMEYVDGQPIDEYCDRRRLSVNARLKLFIQICKITQFAHQHGVIHRSMKPSNILVAADGTPKLIGFGIAKFVDPETGTDEGAIWSAERAAELVERVASPEYLSPEQVRCEIVTTSTDIYGLGLVLYQLLCGHWPYRLTGQSKTEILQAICEQAPEKPSAAVNRSLGSPRARASDPTIGLTTACSPDTSSAITPVAMSPVASKANAIATSRRLSPARLGRVLSGDLDLIVLMAIRKEPEWRYSSAEDLSNDLACYLDGLPVQAHKKSLAYGMAKLIRRHAVLVACGLVVFISLLAGVIRTRSRLAIVDRERNQAERAFDQAHETVDQLVTSICQARLFSEPALDPLRRKLLQDTQHFYENFLTRRNADPTFRAEIAMAHIRVGEIARQTGSLDSAVAHYQQSILRWDKLVEENQQTISIKQIWHVLLAILARCLLPSVAD